MNVSGKELKTAAYNVKIEVVRMSRNRYKHIK